MKLERNVNNLKSPQAEEKTNQDIDEILRGEISAVEAYQQISEKVNSDPEASRIDQFAKHHASAVDFWKKQAKFHGYVPEQSSSVWGKAVEAFVGTSKLIGESTALKALKLGEEHGLKNYEKMLTSDELSAGQKLEIRNQFIPRQKRHIEGINAILNYKA